MGQVIAEAEVMGAWDKFGAMIDLRGPKKLTESWIPTSAHLSKGDRDDMRVQAIGFPTRKVMLEMLDIGARPPVG